MLNRQLLNKQLLKKHLLLILLLIITLTFSSCRKKQFTVSFDSNGGSIIENIVVDKGDTVNQPNNPIKEGYLFIEWQLDGIKYDFKSKVKKDLTLVAAWEKVNTDELITITFDTNGGSIIESKVINKGSKIILEEEPKKDNYVFAGWSLNGEEFDFNQKIYESITLVALWKKPLSTPKNIKYENGYISFDEVPNATNYEIWINGEKNIISDNVFKFNLKEKGLAIVSVASLSETGKSISSNEQILYHSYSVEEIIKSLNNTVSKEDVNKNLDVYQIIMGAFVKFDFTYQDYNSNVNSLKIFDLIDEGKFSNYFAVASTINNSLYLLNETETLITPSNNLQSLFENMKNTNSYYSTYINYYQDLKFCNIIVPVIGYFMYQENIKIDIEVNQLIYHIIDYFGSYYQIIRNNDEYLFVKYSGESYSLTDVEIKRIVNFYQQRNSLPNINDNTLKGLYDNEIKMYEYLVTSYQKYLNDLYKQDAYLSQIELIKSYDNIKSLVNQTTKKLSDAYFIARGYQDKLNELKQLFLNIENKDQLDDAIIDAKNFAKQVSLLLEENLPTKDELTALITAIKGYFIEFGTCSNINDLYQSLEIILNEMIETINSSLTIIDKIEVIDIKNILSLLEDESNELGIDSFNKIIKMIEDTVTNIEIEDNVNYEILIKYYFSKFSEIDYESIKSKLSVAFNTNFNQNDTFIQETNLFINYIKEYDLTKFNSFIKGLYLENVDINILLDDIFDFIDYLTKYNLINILVKYEDNLKSFLNVVCGIKNDNLDKIYQLIKENINTINLELSFKLKVEVAKSLYLKIYDNELDLLKKIIEIGINEYSNDNYVKYQDLVNKINCINNNTEIDEDYKNNLFYQNYLQSMNQILLLVGKSIEELSPLEIKLINDFSLVDWVYPILISQ